MLKFGDFEADTEAGELRRRGERVALQDKPFQLLVALLDKPGEVVSREELAARLWPDVHVDFDGNLNAAAKKLREALGDSASRPRLVETVPRRGYRFIGPLKPPEIPPHRRFPGWLAAVVPLAVVLAVVVAARLRPPERSPERVMLVVLPFDNLSGDPSQDFVSDGMTEELITALGRIDPARLGVLARITSMSYKGSSQGAAEIGRDLGVDYLLEGSFRGTTEHARITAQLIAAEDQTHLWAETYDTSLEDLLRVQADIARRIARSLTLELLDARRGATKVPEAYDHYLRGRYQWSRFTADGYRIAIAELRRAVEADPDYALAHAALADAYNLYAFQGDGAPTEWFARARRSAERALEIEADLAEAHNSLAFALLYGEYDAVAADSIFRRALDLDPNYAMAYHWRAGSLAALGRHDEAIAAARRALELDPLSLSVRSDLGWYFLFADRWEEAASECRATLEQSPGYGWALACLIEASLQRGDYAEAVRHTVERLRQAGVPVPDLDALPPRQAMEKIFRALLERELAKDDADASPFYRAVLFGRLGELDQAMDALEEAYARHDPWLVFLWADPRLDPLHRQQRFTALASQLRIAPRALQ